MLDLVVAVPVLLVTWPLILFLGVVSTVDTRASGLFRQERIGQDGRPFVTLKIRTMRPSTEDDATITVRGDSRITGIGALMRRLKLDELPQFLNVVTGKMSLVGPRPDVAGYADQLVADDEIVLACRPGITGPATLVFRDEESLLARQDNPEEYNDTIVWPAKVAINRAFANRATLADDVRLMLMTLRAQPDTLESMLRRWEPGLLDIDVVRAELRGCVDI